MNKVHMWMLVKKHVFY